MRFSVFPPTMRFSVLTASPSQYSLAASSESQNLRQLVTLRLPPPCITARQPARRLEPEEMSKPSPFSPQVIRKRGLAHPKTLKLSLSEWWMPNAPCVHVFTLFKLVSLQLHFRALSLLCDSVTSLALPLVNHLLRSSSPSCWGWFR